MALTVEQAQQAGQIAAAIVSLEQIISDLQTAIANGVSLYAMRASIVGAGDLFANMVMSQADTATIFNAVLTVCQNNLTQLNAQLGEL